MSRRQARRRARRKRRVRNIMDSNFSGSGCICNNHFLPQCAVLTKNEPETKDNDGKDSQENPRQVTFDKGTDRFAIAAH